MSPTAQIALDDLSAEDLSERAILPLLIKLRKTFSKEQAAVLVDQARLRRKGMNKFSDADKLLFIEEALEQASSPLVAEYRARRMGAAREICDLGCGIGADSIAFAKNGVQVLAIERDPLRARIARANFSALGLDDRTTVICADWRNLKLPPWVLFADPSRRVQGRRVFGLEQMDPPLSHLLPLLKTSTGLAVKAAPGINHRDIPHDAEASFISEKHEMKEAVLWFGALREGPRMQAVLLPGLYTIDSDLAEATELPCLPREFLYEPDPAVIRAGLVRHLAGKIDGRQIDPEIAYLTAGHIVESPFVRGWQVLRHGRFHLKTLNQWLREVGASRVILKKRGSPVDVDRFIKRLKTIPKGDELTVFLTHALGNPWMVLAKEI